jgi:hypothetical protein
MMNYASRLNIGILTAILIFITGCTNNSPATTEVTPNVTEALTETATIQPTELPTATQTFSATQTLVVEATKDISSLVVLGAGPTNGVYLLNFEVPGIDRTYLLTVDGIPFQCEILTEYGERLSCFGPMLPWGKNVNIQFIDPKSGQTFHQIDYTLPAFDYGFGKPIKPACVNPNACPDRGEQFWCETEIRQNEHGYCMVATCTDICGFCVGIDTCHQVGKYVHP